MALQYIKVMMHYDVTEEGRCKLIIIYYRKSIIYQNKMILCSCIEGERKSLSCSINSNAVANEYTLSAELKYMMVYMFTYDF